MIKFATKQLSNGIPRPCIRIMPMVLSLTESGTLAISAAKALTAKAWAQCCQMAKFDCAPTPSTLAQSQERKGPNFAV